MLKDLHCRYMIRRDLKEVVAIDKLVYRERYWSDYTFINYLKMKNGVGKVIEQDGCIVGYALYRYHKKFLGVLRIVVHPQYRRNKVATHLIDDIKSRLKDRELIMSVRESNLEGQLFLRSLGFKAIKIHKDFYTSYGVVEDGYIMQYLIPNPTLS